MLIFGVPVYFNALTVACLLPVLLALTSTVYILTLRHKTLNTWMFAATASLLGVFDFAYAAASAVHDSIGAYHRWITVVAVLPAVAFLFLFLVTYSEDVPGKTERRIFLSMLGVALIASGYFFVQSLRAPHAFRHSGQFWDFEMPRESIVMAVLILLYVSITIIRSMTKFRRMKNRSSARNFLYLVLTSSAYLLPSAILNPLARKGVVTFELFLWVQAVGTAFIFLVVYLIFLSHTRERTTVSGNVIGATLVLVVSCIPLLGYPIIEDRKASFREIWTARLSAGVSPASDRSIAFLVPKEIAGPVPGEIASAYFRDNKAYYRNALAALPSDGVIVRADRGGGIYTFPVDLPEISRSADNAADAVRVPRGSYLLGIELVELRKYIHSIATKLVLAQIVIILVVVGLFPFFIRGILLTPMNRLLNGVIAVSRGRYGHRIESSRSDELGVISRHFDQMAEIIEAATTRLEDTVKQRTAQLTQEKKKSDQLLLNILPRQVAEELKETGRAQPRRIEAATVLFTDFVGFTRVSENLMPEQVVDELDKCFSYFDQVVEKYRLEKLKTIGDSYMCAGGVPVPNQTHAIDCCLAALEIQSFMNQMKEIKSQQGFEYWELRLGIHSGPLVAGVVGHKKFAYDIWGDTVNTASRLESTGTPGKINISAATQELLAEFFECEYRGKIEAKHKGHIDMYYLLRIRSEFAADRDGRVPNKNFRSVYKKIMRARGNGSNGA